MANEAKKIEQNNAGTNQFEYEKGSGFDLTKKLEQKIKARKKETNVKNREFREFLETNNVLTIKEDVSMNYVEFDERFLKSLDKVLLDYILTEFTLKELIIFTISCKDGYTMNEVGYRVAKQQTVQIINSIGSLSPEERNRMKRKVWDTNYILYGLIIDFVLRYKIFDGVKKSMK